MKKAPVKKTKKKRKAPGYADGTYSVGNTGNQLAYTDDSFKRDESEIIEPEKKKNRAWDMVKDAGRAYADYNLSAIGLGNVIKPSDYQSQVGTDVSRFADKAINPLGKAALSTVTLGGSDIAGGIIGGLDKKRMSKYARAEGETDRTYSERLAEMGLTMEDAARMLGEGRQTGTGIGSLVRGLFSGKGGNGNAPTDIPEQPQMRADGGGILGSLGMDGGEEDKSKFVPTKGVNDKGFIPKLWQGQGKFAGVFYQSEVNAQGKPTGKVLTIDKSIYDSYPGEELMDEKAGFGKYKVYNPTPQRATPKFGEVQKSSATWYKDGGKVEGPGTANSDSIKAKVEKGSFVVPEENAGIAQAIRNKYLGASKKANVQQPGGADVRLSDGEHLFTPDEKAYLEGMGVNMAMLAPNAERSPVGKYAEGTTKEGVEEMPMKQTYLTSELEVPTLEESGLSEEAYKAAFGDKVKSAETKAAPTERKKMPSWINPENVLAAGQTGAGIYALLKDGKRPVDVIDPQFENTVNQARGEAAYGLNSYEKNIAQKDIESSRAGQAAESASLAGGNLATAMANIRKAGTESSENLTKLASADANLKLQKQRYADQLVHARSEMKRRLFQDKLNAFMQNQKAGADLLSSGISNFFTSRYNEQAREAEKQANETANTDWTNMLYNMQLSNSKQGK